MTGSSVGDVPGYAIARLRAVEVGPEIGEYIERIEATLSPFGGRFLVHGGGLDVREGIWEGDLVVLQFPSVSAAEQWYESASYRAIAPLRTRNSDSSVVIVEGVHADYDPAEKARALGVGRSPSPGEL